MAVQPSNRAGTRDELRHLLADAGLGPRQTAAQLDHPAALLSGLVPSEAITDPQTADRARLAAGRLAARLPDRAPELVRVVAARLVSPGGYELEMDFEWGGGSETRVLDLSPFLWGPVFDELRDDPAAFAAFFISDGTVSQPGGADLAPELLYSVSGPVAGRPTSEAR